jgi:Ion channel
MEIISSPFPMFAYLLLLFGLVSVCVALHGMGMILGLKWLTRYSSISHEPLKLSTLFWIFIGVVYGLLLLHLLQIAIWALCYQWYGCFPDFASSFYYSATSYSTVGYGDLHPPEEWRILGAIEAVTGILMFGWSTGALFSIFNLLLERTKKVGIPQSIQRENGR